MSRFTVCLFFFVAAAYVMADEECPDGCPCGQVCNGGECVDGCMVFDTFLAAGETSPVYNRDCECSNDVDEKGRIIMCADGVDFVDAPAGEAWTQNPNC